MTDAVSADELPAWVAKRVSTLIDLSARTTSLPSDRESIAKWLYANWYLGAPLVPSSNTALDPERLVRRLRAVLPESPFESGWTVERECPELGPGTLEVRRDGTRKIVSPQDFIADPPLRELRSGLTVSVAARCDSVAGGFWRTWSSGFNHHSVPIARVYWSVPLDGLLETVSVLTQRLPQDLPWLLKVGVDTGTTGRPDSVVLYLRSSDVSSLKTLLREIYGRVAPLLTSTTPAFTRPLGPGLAVAEDPTGDESFGELICRVVAGVVLQRPEPNAWLAALSRAFEEEGLDLQAPDRRARSR